MTEPQTGAVVKVLPGTFSAATTVTVQPVTNTLPAFGLGDGVSISTADAPTQPLVVTFPYGSEVSDPAQLGLGAQATIGLWYALKVRVDPASHTVAAELPTLSAVVPGALSSSAAGGGSSATVARRRWTNEFTLQPFSATVTVGQSAVFTPIAFAVRPGADCTPCVVTATEDCLLGAPGSPPCPLDEVTFTNQKAGYTRTWYVEDQPGGNGALGTIVPAAGVGATYTAPASKPSPNPVTVKFQSTDDTTHLVAAATAPVRVINGYHLVGAFSATDYPICSGGFVLGTASDGFELDLKQTSSTSWDGSNYTDSAAGCPPPWTVPPGYDPARTSVGACEFDSVNDVTTEMQQASGAISVTLYGTSQIPDCVVYIQDSPTGSALPGSTSPEISLFPKLDLDDVKLASFGQQVFDFPVAPGSGTGEWKITVTEIP